MNINKFSIEKRARKGVWLRCETCKREFYVFPSRLEQVKKARNTIRYCSMKCYKKTGDDNPFWGKKHSDLSIQKMRENPNRPKFKTGEDNPNFIRFGKQSGFVGNTYWWWAYHKDVISKVCQRCGYNKYEILMVHHKDRDHGNNTKENIEILCPNCHQLEHYTHKDGTYWNMK